MYPPMNKLLLAVMALLSPLGAHAAEVRFTVRDGAGNPVPNAVLTVYPVGGAKGPIHFAWPLQVAQHDLQFDPFVLVAPVGASVAFPNQDKVRHHVYSFSAGNRFDLKLYGREQARSVVFKAVGVAAIGCNIHDQMIGFIKVVDTPYAIKTGPDGVAWIDEVPAGGATAKVWHPALKAANNEISIQLAVPASGVLRQEVKVDLRPSPAMSRAMAM
jgi:plastocyanin